MAQKQTGDTELLAYVKSLHRIRSDGSAKKKLYYFALYNFIIPMLKLSVFLVRPFFRAKAQAKTDILVVGTCLNDIKSTAHIWEALRSKGLRVATTYPKSKAELLKSAFRTRTSLQHHSMLFLYACYADYLAARYSPRLACLFDSYDSFPTFMRRALHPEGKTVYMPHAVIPTTYLFSSFDYDQYFVFGESSVRNLANQDLCFGETRIVKVGSPRILPGYVLPATEPSHHFLYFSNWMIGEDERYTRDFEILRAWALEHPESQLTVKLHPLEKNGYVPRRCRGIPNMRVLPSGTGMKEALEEVCLVISGFSSAMVEAALMKRPSVIINARKYDPESKDVRESDKLLYLEQYFTARAQTPEQLQQRIEQTLQNYSHYISRCGEFVKFHYEYTLDAPERVVAEIEHIVKTK